MRLALITPGYAADERDWCVPAVTSLVRALAETNDVRVFALRYPHRRGAYGVASVPVHALGGRPGPVGRLALLIRALRLLRREGARARFDVVHGLWADEAGYVATASGRALGVPSLVSLLGGELVALRDIAYGTRLSPAGRTLVSRALRRADAVTVGSHAMAVMASGRVPASRLHRLPLGVDTRLFTPQDGAPTRAALPGAPALLHVASLAPVKDQVTLLRSFSRVAVAIPAARLHVVGGGPLRPRLERVARELAVGERVTFHGAIPHHELPAYYRAADLCVLSSRFESQSMAALEAAACSRATVGTAVGVLPELFPAVSVPVGDAEGLAAAILELAHDPSRRAVLGEEGRTAVAARFTLAHALAELTALYGRLVEERAA
jgi:glycosyltransferase involved in cell wall biosynthesis